MATCSNVLRDVLTRLQAMQVTLTELFTYVLVQEQYNGPATAAELARTSQHWHFGAASAEPRQIYDFQLEDMGQGLRERAPEIWSLVKSIVILSIILHNNDQHCNALQSIIGIFLHSCGAPEKLIKVLSRSGLSISLASIHRATHSLAAHSTDDVEELGQTLLASYTFDNLDTKLPSGIPTVDSPADGLIHIATGTLLRLDHGVLLDNLCCSRLLWDRSPFNPLASDPRPYQSQGPEVVEQIPIEKLYQTPLRAMDISLSTITGNLEALGAMFAQGGVGDSQANPSFHDISEYVTIVHGDLGTYEKVDSATRRRKQERTPYNRLQHVAMVPGLFHLKMAAADAIWRILVTPDDACVDQTSFIKIIGQLWPVDSSRLVSHAKFRERHDLIGHRWGFATLDDWAASKPDFEAVEGTAQSLVREYIEGEDEDIWVRENTVRTLHYLLLYEELSYTMNAGDISRFETVLVPWICIFRAVGKHKYATYMLRFMHALHIVYPPGLRRAIRYNILVNPTGKPHAFRAVDWIVELLNLYIKVIYGGDSSNYTKERILIESILVLVFRSSHANIERNFKIPGLTTKHAEKDMRATFKEILDGYMKMTGRGANYSIPDRVVRGIEVLTTEWSTREGEQTKEGEQEEGGNAEADDELLDDITADDLNTDGLI
ncbi:hypothetical protein PYCCODRAFT_1444206 [Trametes coccinea BRFM310]|uniref:DUF6589 domain-containing protein n=1 Tax=Trametes coccinea (strain BRFM310) TaxID=1353009 RepID=A0A1Y2IV38_TRAC3|nr:hypothetical protein PYCCODRAFT_1444206 [Trametes coccinea BRFM310]